MCYIYKARGKMMIINTLFFFYFILYMLKSPQLVPTKGLIIPLYNIIGFPFQFLQHRIYSSYFFIGRMIPNDIHT
jgi:hypothetical protein